jgi:hypothetical protein
MRLGGVISIRLAGSWYSCTDAGGVGNSEVDDHSECVSLKHGYPGTVVAELLCQVLSPPKEGAPHCCCDIAWEAEFGLEVKRHAATLSYSGVVSRG